MKHILLLLSLAAVLCACSARGENGPLSSPPSETNAFFRSVTGTSAQQTDDLPQSVSVISPYADSIDFLDLDASSWEREHPVEMIVIHFSSAVILDRRNPYDMKLIRRIFENGEIGIHYIIERDGTVDCWLPEDREAWHAGKGSYGTYIDNLNRYSIGIELCAIGNRDEMSAYLTPSQYDSIPDGLKGYTEEQYESLRLLLSDLCERYGIPRDRSHVIGHDEYSPKKSDPGSLFNWDRVMD